MEHPQYQVNLKKNITAEKDRTFCRHNLQHFLDVARVGYIIALEKNMEVEKEQLYAAALLHDIGRWKQYIDGSDHAIISGEIAKIILEECSFTEEEVTAIVEAIRKHRKGENLKTSLDIALYEGDKQSRLCIDCIAIDDCKRFYQHKKPSFKY